jgi:hypothetical protein
MLMGLIASLISYFKLRSRLKQCLLTSIPKNVEVFEYKGKIYDRVKFVLLQSDAFANLKLKDLEKLLNEYESGLVKSKAPDLDIAFIDACKLAISNKARYTYS